MNTFKGRDFLKLLDFTPAEIGALLDLSADLKAWCIACARGKILP